MKFTSIIFSDVEAQYVHAALTQLQDNIRSIPCNDTKGMNNDIINIEGIIHKFKIAQFEEPNYLVD